MTRLDAAEYERAITWNLAIAAELIGTDIESRDEGKERCWGTFHVCRQTGMWHDWAAVAGGISSIELVQHLKRRVGEGWSHQDASQWMLKFLGEHPGTGALEAEDEEWTKTRQAALQALAQHDLDIAEPLPEGGPELAYLASRGLTGPYPEALRRVPNARPGESALLMPLIAHGRVTGAFETYIDALGRKSLVLPNRRRLDLERAPGAVMVIQEPTPGVVDLAATIVAAEGLENSLSIAHPAVARPGWRIIGLPGINALKNMSAKAGDRVIFFQDSDPDGSPARAGLQAGIDSLILQGASAVRCTEWNKAGDANAILQTQDLGTKALKRLLATPAGGALSFEGEVKRLADMPPTEYEKARRTIAKAHDVRVQHLDREVALRRPKPLEGDEGSAPELLSVPEDPAWAGPVPVLLLILDTIRKHFRRFVSITEEQLTAVVLWVAAAHLVNSTKLDIDLFPKLAIESKDPASGKTTLLTLIWNCLPRAKLWTYPTGAYLVRALEQARFSLCLDELQYAEDRNLLRVINASQHRAMAYVPLLVPDHKGAYVPHEYFVWAPMALARLGEFSTAQQSRSIIIWMLPKLPGEKKEHLRRPLVPELAACRRQLAAWADSLTVWTDPKLPALLHNRDADNWIPLFFVAEKAGGPWPELAEKAVEELMKTERQPTVTVRLLRSLWPIYQPKPEDDPQPFLATADLLAAMIRDPDEDWNTMGPAGRSITAQWLRERFAHLLDPPGSTRESAFGPRGYAFRQFEKAFQRYLGTHPATDTLIVSSDTLPDRSGTSGSTGEKDKKDSKFTGDFKPDAILHPAQAQEHPAQRESADTEPDDPGAKPDAKSHPAQENLSVSAKKSESEPLEPDVPDQSERVSSTHITDADEWSWTAGSAPVEQSSAAEAEKPPETREASPRSSARSRRARKTSGDPAGVPRTPQLDLPQPEPSLIDYIEASRAAEGSIAAEVRQLKAANPTRSIKWIAKQSGQPPSVVREILGNGEDVR